ncbi:DUF2283 domain-containing protein [Kineococcus sp. SYSU DK005]|uniref:DUF2283 domain-containing protein n=1 Tax=Kineococcus sp. SYSU DK005 TaxID=3383126 RepID=UPI003D7D50C5
MNGTWDASEGVDAAYLYFNGECDGLGHGEHAPERQVFAHTARRGAWQLVVDLDADGRVLGLEVLGASQALTPAFLQRLQRIDERIDEDVDDDAPGG